MHAVFFFFQILIFTYTCTDARNIITKAIRRRGKELVKNAHIAMTNEHGELFRVKVQRDPPFRSATSDVGQVFSRSNNDFQFMPRILDLEALQKLDSEAGGRPKVELRLALGMYGV